MVKGKMVKFLADYAASSAHFWLVFEIGENFATVCGHMQRPFKADAADLGAESRRPALHR